MVVHVDGLIQNKCFCERPAKQGIPFGAALSSRDYQDDLLVLEPYIWAKTLVNMAPNRNT